MKINIQIILWSVLFLFIGIFTGIEFYKRTSGVMINELDAMDKSIQLNQDIFLLKYIDNKNYTEAKKMLEEKIILDMNQLKSFEKYVENPQINKRLIETTERAEKMLSDRNLSLKEIFSSK